MHALRKFIRYSCIYEATFEPHPKWKFSSTALQTQQCDQNTQQNNLQFLHGTATCTL